MKKNWSSAIAITTTERSNLPLKAAKIKARCGSPSCDEASVSSGMTEQASMCSIARSRKKMRFFFLHRRTGTTRGSRRSVISTLSTLPIAEIPERSGDPSSKSSRKVRFNKTVRSRKIPSASSLTPKEKSQIWLTAEDRQRIKMDAHARVRETQALRPSYEKALDQLFNKSRFLAHTGFFDGIESTLKDEQSFKMYTGDLLHWAKNSYRGLEERFCEIHHFSRAEQIAVARTAVTSVSTRRRFVDEDDIALHYKDMAMASVVMAQLLGKADEYAARKVYMESTW